MQQQVDLDKLFQMVVWLCLFISGCKLERVGGGGWEYLSMRVKYQGLEKKVYKAKVDSSK
jgi:hypothetical protein